MKKYFIIIIIMLNSTLNYGQYIGSFNSIGSNFIGLSPYLRTMSADKGGNVYYSDICKSLFTIDGKSISPGLNQPGIQQIAYDKILANSNINNIGDFQTFAYNVNRSDVGVQEVITLALPSGKLALIYNFDQDIITWVDTLKIHPPKPAGPSKEIAIAVYKDNVRQWTKQSSGFAWEYALSATYDEHENIYIMGWFLKDLINKFKDTVPAQFDTLKLYPPSYTLDPNRDFKSYFIVSYNANGKLRWGKSIYAHEGGSLGKITYKQGRGLLFDIHSPYLYIDGAKIANNGNLYGFLNFHINMDTAGNTISSDNAGGIAGAIWEKHGSLHCEVPFSNNVYSLSYFNQRMKVGKDSMIPKFEYPPDSNFNTPEIYLAKKVNGQYTEAKSIALLNPGLQPVVTEMLADSAGRVYILGHFSDTLYIHNRYMAPKTKQDIFLACYDSNFKLLWLQTGHGNSDKLAYASGMAIFGNKVTINGYVHDTFYWEDQYMDNEQYMHMFLCRFEVFNSGVKMVSNPRQAGTLKVWPNPANSTINIQHFAKQKEDISIYNILGELIYNDKWELADTQKSIDLSSFSKGLYIIRIGDAVEKVILE